MVRRIACILIFWMTAFNLFAQELNCNFVVNAQQTGNENVTVQNLKVVKVISEKNLIVLKGCVPGHKNSYLSIKK